MIRVTGKPLQKLVPAAVLIFAVASVYAQTVNPAKVKINGVIGLDSTYAQVVKAFGKPVKETKPQKEECTGGHEKTVKYAGLEFYFMDGPSKGGKTFEVMTFDVTSSKYTVSGVKVGDSEAAVRRRFGRPKSVDTDPNTGEKVWHYEIGERDGPGWTTVTFKNGKVVSLGSAYTVC
jgi:hypothetical protein